MTPKKLAKNSGFSILSFTSFIMVTSEAAGCSAELEEIEADDTGGKYPGALVRGATADAFQVEEKHRATLGRGQRTVLRPP
jgi:hypothetical protein